MSGANRIRPEYAVRARRQRGGRQDTIRRLVQDAVAPVLRASDPRGPVAGHRRPRVRHPHAGAGGGAGARAGRARSAGVRPDRIGQDAGLRHGDRRGPAGGRPAGRVAPGAGDRPDPRAGRAGGARAGLAVRRRQAAHRGLHRRHAVAGRSEAAAGGRGRRRRHARAAGRSGPPGRAGADGAAGAGAGRGRRDAGPRLPRGAGVPAGAVADRAAHAAVLGDAAAGDPEAGRHLPARRRPAGSPGGRGRRPRRHPATWPTWCAGPIAWRR